MIYLIPIILILAVLIWRAFRNARRWEGIERFCRKSGGTEPKDYKP